MTSLANGSRANARCWRFWAPTHRIGNARNIVSCISCGRHRAQFMHNRYADRSQMIGSGRPRTAVAVYAASGWHPPTAITSPAASARATTPSRENSIPTARLLSNRMRCAPTRKDELEVRPLQRRPQIGARGAGATPPAAGLLAPSDAVAGARRQVVDVLARCVSPISLLASITVAQIAGRSVFEVKSGLSQALRTALSPPSQRSALRK